MAFPTRIGAQYNGVTAAGSIVANYPAGTSSGDLIIIHVATSYAAIGQLSFTLSDAANWTQITDMDVSARDGIRVSTYWRFRGAETSVTVTSSLGATNNRFIIALVGAYTAASVDSVAPVDLLASGTAFVNGSTNTTSAALPVSLNVPDSEVMYFGTSLKSGNTAYTWSWTGATELVDNWTGSVGLSLAMNGSVAWAQQASTGLLSGVSATLSTAALQRANSAIVVRPPFSSVVAYGYPQLAARSQGFLHSNATTRNITMPSGAATDDLLIAVVDIDGAQTISSSTSGWTKKGEYGNASGDDVAVFVGVKGTAAEPLVVTNTTTKHSAWAVYAIRNWNGNLTNVEVASATGSSTNQNPPSLSPALGQKKYMWLAVGVGANNTTWPTLPPTGFPDLYVAGCNTTGTATAADVSFGIAWTVEDVATKDPGTFTSPTAAWSALTIAIPPSEILTQTGADTASGADNATVNEVTPPPGPTQVGSSSNSGTGQDLTINYPSSLTGDYITAMVHFYKTTGTGAPTITTPTGWTLLETQSAGGTDPYVAAMYGRFRGAETSVTFSANTATNMQSIGSLYAYRNVDMTNPVVDSSIAYELGTTGSHSTPSVTTTTANNRIWRSYIANGRYQSAPGAVWTSSSEAVDTAVTIDSTRRVNLSAATNLKETAGSTGTETVTQSAPLDGIVEKGMDKSGTQSISASAGTYKVTSWVAQAGTSSGDIVNDELVVTGAGKIIVTADLAFSGALAGSLRIYKNGVEVASNASPTGLTGSTFTDPSWPIGWIGDVVEGDSIALYIVRTAGTARTVNSGFLKINTVPRKQIAYDGFTGTGSLGSNWSTTGGGTLVRTNGELDGTGTPSTPLSYAWWQTAAPSSIQRVSVVQKKNGRNPEHSSWAPVVRASPGDDHGNPGEENGVQFAITDSIVVMIYEDFSIAEGWVALTPTYLYVGPNGYADNSVIEIISIGDWYYGIVNGTIVLTGTTAGAIDQANVTVGAMIQNDELEAGGGEPPANLDDWTMYAPGDNGQVHYFSGTVALQTPQDYTMLGTETGTAADTATTDVDTGTQNDTGASSDVASQRITAATDATSPASDSAAARAYAGTNDTAAGADNAGASATVPQGDTATSADTATVSVTQYGIETATGNEAAAQRIYADDARPVTDTAAQRVSGSETGSASDDGGIWSTQASGDTVAGADTATGIRSAATESATGAETASTTSVTSASETATGADTSAVKVGVATDSGSGSDSATATNTAQTGDSATGNEAATVRVSDTDLRTSVETASQRISGATDTAVTADDGGTWSSRSDADTGTSVDSASRITTGAADTETSTDNAGAAAQTGTTNDPAVGADTAPVVKLGPVSDSGSGSDTAFATNTAPTGDSGALTNESATVRFSVTDPISSFDFSTTDTDTAPNEPVIGSESATVIIVHADTSSGVDTSTMRVPVADNASGTDSVVLAVTQFGTDTAGSTDSSGLLLRQSDSFVNSDEVAFKGISGILQGARIVRIAAESRVWVVTKDPSHYDDGTHSDGAPRTIKVLPEQRVFVAEGV